MINRYNKEGFVRIFSYILGDQADPSIPSKIACNNTGTMNQIREGGDLKTTMVKYYEYFGATQAEIWSAPYIDAFGLGLMITRSVPVFDFSDIDPITGLYKYLLTFLY